MATISLFQKYSNDRGREMDTDRIVEGLDKVAKAANSANGAEWCALMVAGVALGLSFWAFWIARKQAEAQVFESVLRMLQDDTVRRWRRYVYNRHEHHQDDKWPPKLGQIPRKVAMTFDIAAAMAEKSQSVKDELLNNWKFQIVKAGRATARYLRDACNDEGLPCIFPHFCRYYRIADSRLTELERQNLKYGSEGDLEDEMFEEIAFLERSLLGRCDVSPHSKSEETRS